MTQSLTFTSVRHQAIREFKAVRTRALLNSWLARILMRPNGLRTIVGSRSTGLNAKRPTRIQRIRVDRIVGTIRYTEDFDQNFRPLTQQSRERWVQAFLQLDEDRLQPIAVHKVGEFYYVAKGHYSVSVARHVGMRFIEAEVWDHTPCPALDDKCASNRLILDQHTKSFSTN